MTGYDGALAEGHERWIFRLSSDGHIQKCGETVVVAWRPNLRTRKPHLPEA